MTEADVQDEVDNVFKEKKKQYIEEVVDDYSDVMDKINKNYAYAFLLLKIREEKFKQLSILPTRSSDYNLYIKNNESKIFII